MEKMLAEALRALLDEHRRPISDPCNRALHFAVLTLALHDKDDEVLANLRDSYRAARSMEAAALHLDASPLTDDEAQFHMILESRKAAALAYDAFKV